MANKKNKRNKENELVFVTLSLSASTHKLCHCLPSPKMKWLEEMQPYWM